MAVTIGNIANNAFIVSADVDAIFTAYGNEINRLESYLTASGAAAARMAQGATANSLAQRDASGNLTANVFAGNLSGGLTATTTVGNTILGIAPGTSATGIVGRAFDNTAGHLALAAQAGAGGTVWSADAIGATVQTGTATVPFIFSIATNTNSNFTVRAAGLTTQSLWTGQNGAVSPVTTSQINSDGSSVWGGLMTASAFSGNGALVTNVVASSMAASGLIGLIPVGNYGDRTIPTGKLTELAVSAQGTPAMTVAIAAGDYPSSTNVIVSYAGGNSPAFVAPGVGVNRIDALSLDDGGNPTITQGTAAVSPTRPIAPTNMKFVCYVYLRASTIAIYNLDQGTGGTGYIFASDARFFGGNGGSGGGGGGGIATTTAALTSGDCTGTYPNTKDVTNNTGTVALAVAPASIRPALAQSSLKSLLGQGVSANAMLSLQASGAALQLTVLNGPIEVATNGIWNEIIALTTTSNNAGSAGMYKLVATLNAAATAPTLRLTQGSPLTNEIELANCYYDGALWQLYIVWWPCFQQLTANGVPNAVPRFTVNVAGGTVNTTGYAAIPGTPPPIQTVYLPTQLNARIRYVANFTPSAAAVWADMLLLIDGVGSTSGINVQGQASAGINTFSGLYDSPSPLAITSHTFQLMARCQTVSQNMQMTGITFTGEFFK
jgi:hypothetical protein